MRTSMSIDDLHRGVCPPGKKWVHDGHFVVLNDVTHTPTDLDKARTIWIHRQLKWTPRVGYAITPGVQEWLEKWEIRDFNDGLERIGGFTVSQLPDGSWEAFYPRFNSRGVRVVEGGGPRTHKEDAVNAAAQRRNNAISSSTTVE